MAQAEQPHTRQAYYEAFEEAARALQAEVVAAAKDDQLAVPLAGVKNELAAREEEGEDGPMPPLPTLDSLRSQYPFVVVNKHEWKQVPNYNQKLHGIFDSHMGGGTSMSYKLFALFRKGLAATRSAWRAGSQQRAFCELIALTKAMADNDEWYGDTDAPEEAVKIVGALGLLWSSVLASPPDGDFRLLRAWLESVQREWEGSASEYLDEKLTFSWSSIPPATPKKAPAKVDDGKMTDESETKKRKATTSPCSRSKAQKISADTEAWLHAADAELPQRQSSAVQLRCEAGSKKRVLVVSGAYPLKAVGFALAEAFGWAVDDFDPHPNRGKAPSGLKFTVQRGASDELLKPALKIVQAVQEPGDRFSVHMDDHEVVIVSLDAIKLKTDPGFDRVKDRPMPRCVGGDRTLGPQLLRRLNRTFLHGRKPISFIGCSKKEAVNATIDHMARPIALQQGEVLVEGLGIRDEPGTIPGPCLKGLLV